MNTIDKETNTIESKPVSLICLCCRRETIVFKKLHENPPKELPHVMCLLCYQYVIKDMGYDFCPKSSKFNVIFSIFNWFQCDICKQTRFQYSVAKTFHHSDHEPVNFCKFCVEDYKLCPRCKKNNHIIYNESKNIQNFTSFPSFIFNPIEIPNSTQFLPGASHLLHPSSALLIELTKCNP